MNLNLRFATQYIVDKLVASLYEASHYFTLDHSHNRFRYFHHHHNCGFPGRRKTERTVELALAKYWLEKVTNPWEVGAVTPYYWPGKIREIVDPADKHQLITQRKSLFDVDFTGRNILSISTIEHIGEQSYGLNEVANPIQALEKLVGESNLMLLTFPIGWNQILDEFVLSGKADALCKVRFLVRNLDETWSSTSREGAHHPYGGNGVHWANSVAVLEKGSVL